MIEAILAFALVFGVIVIIHEFGHYYFAKKAGILVREFSIGFGPKLFNYRKNETTYTIRLLPLGGYVMMAGYEEEEDLRPGMQVTLLLDEQDRVTKIDTTNEVQDINSIPLEVTDFDLENDLFIEGSIDNNTNEYERFEVNRDALVAKPNGIDLQIAPADRRFQNAKLSHRILTNFAGPLNNFILAILSFIIIAFIQGGVPVDEAVIGEVQQGSPVSETMIEEGDQVVSINGEAVESWTDMTAVIQQNPEEELTFEVEKDQGEVVEETVVPEAQEVQGNTIGQIGVRVAFDDSITAKIASGFTRTWGIIAGIFSVLATIFTGGFTIDNLGGPVAIFATTEAVVSTGGLIGVFDFLAMLSANLGIMNLLPIPGLDGGKLVLNFVEGIRGKPVSEETEGIITLVGAGLLLLLVIFVTWNDIQRFFF